MRPRKVGLGNGSPARAQECYSRNGAIIKRCLIITKKQNNKVTLVKLGLHPDLDLDRNILRKGKNMSKINPRKLGRSGIEVSPMGLGCWAIGGPFWAGETPLGWGEVDDEESIRAIHAALELGITLFDTANVYGAGHSERVLGRAFAGIRSRVVIATKFNAVFDEHTRQVTGSDTSPAGIRAACEDSLRRLNTDYIDLYQFHDNDFPPDNAEPVRETLERLVEEGKIRAYGWSTDYPVRVEVFAQGPRCTAIQLQLNVMDNNSAVISLCEKYDLAALNRGPLAMELLTDKYPANTRLAADDVRGEKSPEWMKYFKNGKPNPEWLNKRDAVRAILASNGRSVAQGALAWLWARSPKTLPIPGFRTVAQVKENAAAMQFGSLTTEQMQEIDRLLER
jgi:aryl-alcohol dehydrogenase-like predicted oxidoreductase